MNIETREKQLINDCLAYTILNPIEIFNSMTFNEMVSPNIMSLGVFLNTIQSMYKNSNCVAGRFIHDKQKEFGCFLKQQFDMTSRFSTPAKATSTLLEMEETKLFKDTDITFQDSSDSVGIQLIDTCLWIFKKYYFEKKTVLEPLLYEILSRGVISGITHDMHVKEIKKLTVELYSHDIDLTANSVQDGMKFFNELETKRWKE